MRVQEQTRKSTPERNVTNYTGDNQFLLNSKSIVNLLWYWYRL